MDRFYWLVNSNRSRIKRFIENTNNKDQIFKYIFIDSKEVYSCAKNHMSQYLEKN